MSEKAFIATRKDLLARLARAVQHVSGAAVTTIVLTWLDDSGAGTLVGATHAGTTYGTTSSGVDVRALGEAGVKAGMAHCDAVLQDVERHRGQLAAALAKKPNDNGGQVEEPPHDEPAPGQELEEVPGELTPPEPEPEAATEAPPPGAEDPEELVGEAATLEEESDDESHE